MQVTVTVNTQQAQFVGGTVGGDWAFTAALASAPGTVTNDYEGPNTSVTWDLTDGQAYIFTAQRLDASDNAIGPLAQLQFTVGSDLVAIDVANTITASSAPGTRKK
jgi:hypothetical protein